MLIEALELRKVQSGMHGGEEENEEHSESYFDFLS